jgi:Chaperone of endosialidase
MKNLFFICSFLLIFPSGKAQDFTIFDNATTTTQTSTGLSYSRTGSTGINNVAIGSNSLRNNTSGTNNTAIGTNALFRQVEGVRNTAIGTDALKNMKGFYWNYLNTISTPRAMDNVAIGYKAMHGKVDNTGYQWPIYATDNIAIGSNALEEIQGTPTYTGGSIDALSLTNGTYNIAIGQSAMKKTQNAGGNIGIGREVLYNTDGQLSTYNATTYQGRENIGLGYRALYNNTTGSHNISIGNSSGSASITDSYKLYIGGGTTPLIGGDLYNGKVGINKTVASLATNTAKLQVGGDIACVNIIFSSDARYKKNIQAIEGALDKVTKMNGVTYDWKISEYPDMNFTDKKQLGFIAQEVEKVLPELVITDSKGYKSVDYVKVVPLLLEAIKEINQDRDTLKNDIIAIQNTLKALIDKAPLK